MNAPRYAIGTKVILREAHGYRVTCATCETGGTRFKTHAAAFSHAANNSARGCKHCGAR